MVDPSSTDYDQNYSDTPNLLHNQDLHLFIKGKEVDLSRLQNDDSLGSTKEANSSYPDHRSKGNSRLINVSDFGSDTYFYARNAVQKTNQTTGVIENYDAKWTLESMNYTNEQALLAFGIKGIVDGGGTTLFNVGSGWQVAKRGNFANTHLQFFKEINTDNFVNQDGTLKESVDDAIKKGDIVATALKIHEGFTDLDSNEAVEVPENAVHKVLVDNNSTLAYQKTDDGYLAITRTYGDISDHDVKYGNSNSVAALLELDVPVEGIDLSIATVGPSNTSSTSELAEGSKVAPAVLDTASYLKELDVNFYQLDENGNTTTTKLKDTKIAHNFIGKSYGVQNTDADGDGNQDAFDYSAPTTIPDKNGDIWTLVSGKTSGNNLPSNNKTSATYQDCLNVINYYYQKSQKVQQGKERVTYKFYSDRNKTKLVKESTWTPVYSDGKWQWQVAETTYDDQGKGTTTTTTQSAKDGLTADQAAVKFTGTVNYDDKTGMITGTTWDNSSLPYGTIKTPVVNGYTADLSSVGGETVVPNTTLDRSYEVVYTPNGKLIPVDEDGKQIPGTDTPTYTTDPNNPTRVENPTVPDIKGWTPKNNKPGDSITPKDPSSDTEVPYRQQVTGKITYIDDTTGKTLASEDFKTGLVGDKVDYTTADKIKSYEDKGYKLVSNNFTDGSTEYKKSGNSYEVHLKHMYETKTLYKTGKQTVHYVDNKGNKVFDDKVQTDDKAFSATQTTDKVTGEITTSAWTGTKTFDKETTPVKDGYHVDKNKKTAGGLTATVEKPDVEDKVVYTPNGKLIPVDEDGKQIPGTKTSTYKTNPNDPTKVENPTVPDIKGWTPKNNKPGDSITPKDPSGDTEVPYRQQVNGKITYIDDTTGKTLASDDFKTGLVGDKVDYTTGDKIKSYEEKGYKLVSNNFTDGTTEYKKSGNDYEVHLEHKTETTTIYKGATQTVHYVDNKGNKVFADKVQTDDKAFSATQTIDKVTGEVVKTTDWTGTKTFDEEITPIFKDDYHADKKVAGGLTATVEKPKVEDTVVYTPNGKLIPVDEDGNKIPGTDTPTYKTNHNDPTKVENPTVPSIDGWTPKNNKPGDSITPEDPSKDTEVPYRQQVNGKITYIDDTTGKTLTSENFKTGLVGDKVDYTSGDKIKSYEEKGYELVSNDFTDGQTTYKKDGNSYSVHLVHTYGDKTLYKGATQTVHYVDNKGAKVFDDKKQADDKAFTATQTVDKVTGEVVKTTDWTGEKTFDKETTPFKDGYHADKKMAGGLTATVENPDVEDTVVYTPNGKLIPVDEDGNKIPNVPTPTIPTDPDDPTKTVPSTDIPDVPNWTPVNPGKTDTPTNPSDDKEVPYTNYGLTEKYVDTEGKELSPSVTKGTRYTTGEKYDVTGDAKVIDGYVLTKTTDTTGTFAHSDKTAVFTYQKVGKIVPVDKDGNPIPNADTPSYHNDPSNPTKVTPNEDIPTVPGYTPVNPGKVTPKDPTKDTLVPYTNYGLTEKYVDTEGKELSPSVTKTTCYTTGEKYDVTKDSKVIDGYVLVKTTDTTGTFEKADKTAVFTYQKVGKIVPVDKDGNPIPNADTPSYHNDPSDPTKVTPNEDIPTVPGYTPVNPSKVTPKDPTKDTLVPYTKDEKPSEPVTPVTPVPTFGLTEKFIDESGKELLPSENKGTSYKTGDSYDVTGDAKKIEGYELVKTTDIIGTFAHSDKTAVFIYKKVETPVTPVTPVPTFGLTEKFVDESGKELLPSENKGTDYKTDDSYDVTGDAKVIDGYVLTKTTDTKGTFDHSDKTAVFTYQKVGKIVPVDKDDTPIPNADTPSYHNDPADPAKVTPEEPVPSVPGYTPSVPQVTPAEPTKDTTVPYSKVETPVAKYSLTEKFVDKDGQELLPSVTKGTDYKTGDSYDVTGDAKKLDGYKLVKTTDTAGTFSDSDKVAVFTYQKVEKEGTPQKSQKPKSAKPAKKAPSQPTKPGAKDRKTISRPTGPNAPGMTNETEVSTSTSKKAPSRAGSPLAPGQAQAATTNSDRARLPQTGSDNEQSKLLTGLGLAALAATALLTLIDIKKRKN